MIPKIRIGNDIRLLIRLLGNKTIDPININHVKAYIINTSVEKSALDKLRNKTRFVSRFPLEPMIDSYTSTAYNINSTGYPTYYAFPKDYVIGSYAGFGCHPHWDHIYRPIPHHNLTEFLAPVKSTRSRNVIEVLFPAEAQLFTGDYKIVIVAKIHQPGFRPNDLRTITMDYENIFTLVNTSDEGEDGPVKIQVGDADQYDQYGQDIFALSGELVEGQDQQGQTTKNVNVNRTDGTSFDIDLSSELSWYEGN